MIMKFNRNKYLKHNEHAELSQKQIDWSYKMDDQRVVIDDETGTGVNTFPWGKYCIPKEWCDEVSMEEVFEALYKHRRDNMDIQINDIITTRCGEKYTVVKMNDKIYFIGYDGFLDLDEYSPNGEIMDDEYCDMSEFDIMEIRRPENPMQMTDVCCDKAPIVYLRNENSNQETKEMTLAEISKALGYKVKVVE